MNPAKRRRMDDAVSALTKPFRSPLHVDPNKQKPSSFEKQDDQTTQVTPGKGTPNNQLEIKPSPIKQFTPLSSPSPLRRPHLSSPMRTPPIRDPEYIALQKQHSTLLLQLKTLSSSLDTVNQALKITQSHKDHELERLITKWRLTSRDAAEDLFTTAKDRVDCMGGVGVWREKFMKPLEEDGWNQEAGLDEDDLTEEQKEQLNIAREEAKVEAEKYGLCEEQQQKITLDQDDDSFTIDLMLKQLNVDLNLIGYDVHAQRWVE